MCLFCRSGYRIIQLLKIVNYKFPEKSGTTAAITAIKVLHTCFFFFPNILEYFPHSLISFRKRYILRFPINQTSLMIWFYPIRHQRCIRLIYLCIWKRMSPFCESGNSAFGAILLFRTISNSILFYFLICQIQKSRNNCGSYSSAGSTLWV